MFTDTPTPPTTDGNPDAAPESLPKRLLGRITRFELVVGAVVAAVMLLLVVIEPDILEAPFENERTLLFTVGGTVLAAVAFIAMLWFRVPAPVRVVVLIVPFAVVNWWLISPYFIDDVVDDEFVTSISEQQSTGDNASAPAPDPAPAESEPATADGQADAEAAAADEPADDVDPAAEPAADQAAEESDESSEPAEATPPPSGPVLLGAGQFIGLAGHDGTGDAGIFQNPDGSLVLRFENFDIENGPDLKVYLVPGADQVGLSEGSIDLGDLKGNIGDQNYDLPADTELAPGSYTALVWCEAFSVEFVGATIVV